METADHIYALKSMFYAHYGDVRVVRPTLIPDGGILTGSRDTTTKVWVPDGKSFKECHIFKGATTFIASLCALPPSEQYPNGLFLAGSNDCSIYGFTPDSSEPVLRLLGHSGTVCTLSYAKGGFIVSGSWDKTARVWSGQQSVSILQGHLEAVWATDVFPTQNLILTASADHTIRLWRSGVTEKIFTGHKDCVRGLAIIDESRFLSCSNDTTIRLWLTSGECLDIFQSHTDYIYSIALLKNGIDFATCGEDQTLKIWRNGICTQTFVFSAKSLWSVTCLSNGDIAVGTSDGKVYVLYKADVNHFDKLAENTEAVCSTEMDHSYNSEQSVATTSTDIYPFIEGPSGSGHPSTSKRNELAFPARLPKELGPKGDGPWVETIESGLAGPSYAPSPIAGPSWAPSPLPGPSGEVPCTDTNKSSDPNDKLIVMYLDQSNIMYVCQHDHMFVKRVEKQPLDLSFIEKTFYKKIAPDEPDDSNFSLKQKDYVFDVEVENKVFKLELNKGDNPWDVASKFVCDHNLPADHIGQIVDYIIRNTTCAFSNEVYPAKSYLTYLNVNTVGLKEKLLEFCIQVPKDKCITPNDVEELMLLAHFPDEVSENQMRCLDIAISWSDEFLYPVLDLLRLAVKSKGLCTKISSKSFVNHLLNIFLHTKLSVNRVLVEKVFCNMFAMDETEDILTECQDKIFEALKEKLCLGEECIQKAAAALFLNFAVASYNGFSINTETYCSTVVEVLSYLGDSEAIYRTLLAIGTACTRNPYAVTYFRSISARDMILKFRGEGVDARTHRIVDLLCSDL